MQSKLIGWHKSDAIGYDIVFKRQDDSGKIYEIKGKRCYESWEQWGAPTKILADNVDTIESWRKGNLTKGENV